MVYNVARFVFVFLLLFVICTTRVTEAPEENNVDYNYYYEGIRWFVRNVVKCVPVTLTAREGDQGPILFQVFFHVSGGEKLFG